uniref:transposase n=1 Tax=Dyadobacter diqingensis TaxID=2938121 RepID=UPI0020C21EA6|nr:transposase [Dyadobacter diqingensis]
MGKTEFEQMCEKGLEQMMKGQSLSGKDGAFAPLLQQFLKSGLDSEMNTHLNEQKSGNKRRGKGSKRFKDDVGRRCYHYTKGSKTYFFSQIVEKREAVLVDNLARQIIRPYSKGMNFRDISDHIQQMYDVGISHATLSGTTERVIPQVKECQSRPLESLYTIVWLDAMHRRETPEIRNLLKYVASKDQKTFGQDLKNVHQAPKKDKAELELDRLNDKWRY